MENYDDNNIQLVHSIIGSPNTDGPKNINLPFQTNEHSKAKIHVIE